MTMPDIHIPLEIRNALGRLITWTLSKGGCADLSQVYTITFQGLEVAGVCLGDWKIEIQREAFPGEDDGTRQQFRSPDVRES